MTRGLRAGEERRWPRAPASAATPAMSAATRSGYDAMRGELRQWETELIEWRCSLAPSEVRRLRGSLDGWDCMDLKMFIGQASFEGVSPEMRASASSRLARLTVESVVAAMLKDEGYDVVGVTLQLYDHGAALAKKGAIVLEPGSARGIRLVEQLGLPLALNHVTVLPPTRRLVLAERTGAVGSTGTRAVSGPARGLNDPEHFRGAQGARSLIACVGRVAQLKLRDRRRCRPWRRFRRASIRACLVVRPPSAGSRRQCDGGRAEAGP